MFAFLFFIATYAVGRFGLELLRGDETRGLYLGLSTAQYISIALLAGCLFAAAYLRTPRLGFRAAETAA